MTAGTPKLLLKENNYHEPEAQAGPSPATHSEPQVSHSDTQASHGDTQAVGRH